MIGYVFDSYKKNPNVLNKIVVKYGVAPAINPQDLWKKVNFIVTKFPQDALKDIANIHPDKGLILAMSGSGNSTAITNENAITKDHIESAQKTSGACGCESKTSGCDGGSCKCGGTCGSKKSGADSTTTGTTSTSTDPKISSIPTIAELKSDIKSNLPLVVIAGMFILGAVFVMKGK